MLELVYFKSIKRLFFQFVHFKNFMTTYNPLTIMKPLHILLVEDNDGDILLTIEALEEEKLNFTVVVVKDGW